MLIKQLMPRRRGKRVRLYQTRNPVKHSTTDITNQGSASAPTELVILETDVGARTTTGASQTIRDKANTNNLVQVGSTVKYANIRIQIAGRPQEIGLADQGIGWLEYAFVCVKESETTMPITNVGTTTIPDIATKMYRNECIWTGAIPVSTTVPNVQDMHIKIPDHKTKIRVGDHWRLYTYYRDVLATGTGTDTNRVIVTTQFISYD